MIGMAEARVYSMDGSEVGTLDLPEEAFGTAVSTHLLWEVVRAEQAGARAGLASTRGRSEVRASGRKPWRQKHTGNARAGSFASPIWRGGGIATGPKPRRFHLKVNRKVRRKALAGILSERLGEGNFRVIRDLSTEGRTRSMAYLLKGMECNGRLTVLLLEDDDEMAFRAARNIPNLVAVSAARVPVGTLVNAEVVLVAEGALESLKRRVM